MYASPRLPVEGRRPAGVDLLYDKYVCSFMFVIFGCFLSTSSTKVFSFVHV